MTAGVCERPSSCLETVSANAVVWSALFGRVAHGVTVVVSAGPWTALIQVFVPERTLILMLMLMRMRMLMLTLMLMRRSMPHGAVQVTLDARRDGPRQAVA